MKLKKKLLAAIPGNSFTQSRFISDDSVETTIVWKLV